DLLSSSLLYRLPISTLFPYTTLFRSQIQFYYLLSLFEIDLQLICLHYLLLRLIHFLFQIVYLYPRSLSPPLIFFYLPHNFIAMLLHSIYFTLVVYIFYLFLLIYFFMLLSNL